MNTKKIMRLADAYASQLQVCNFADADKARDALEAALTENQEPIDSNEKAGAYMDARLWEFVDMAASWPKAKPDSRIWDHVLVYAPAAKQEPVAWLDRFGEIYRDVENVMPTDTPLYTHPAPVNQQLLEACKAALSDDQPYIEKCRAAIAAAEKEKT